MADDILPTQPLPPSRPVMPPPEQRRRDNAKKENSTDNISNEDNSETEDKPAKGLLDEYV